MIPCVPPSRRPANFNAGRTAPRRPILRASLLLAFLACTRLVTPAAAEPVISEFMASNSATLADQDQAYSDWIELHNPDAAPFALAGWYLTDSANNRTKWPLPAVTIPAGGYLIVFASNKDRRDPAAELHANFALAAEGEYLGLIRPNGSPAFEYAPSYPAQSNDISFGLVPGGDAAARAYFPTPTPGAANSSTGAVALAATVQFSRTSGPFPAPFSLQLSGAAPGQHIRYVMVPPSLEGAVVPEVTESSPRYAGPIDISAPVLIRAAVFSDDLRMRGLATTAHYVPLDAQGDDALVNFRSTLPILVIDQHGYGGLVKEDEDRPAWLYGYAPRSTALPFGAPPDFVSPVRTSVRGTSSANFAKKSYNLEFLNDLGKDTARPLFGFAPYDEWALVGPYLYDPSYIRNAVVYALSNRIGRWAPRTRAVEVFLNGNGTALDQAAYVGIYMLTDKVDIHPDRVAIQRMSNQPSNEPEITGGYVLKIDIPDANEYSWTTEYGLDLDTLSSVIVASPKADRLSAAQRNYIRGYVQTMENALHADRASGWRTQTYLDYLDRAAWVDHHILNALSANPDALERSAYFHKPRGGKLLAGPVWDFDRALGSHEDLRSFRWDVWQGEGAVQLWNFGWWGVLATDPEFMQEWVDRWQSLRRDTFSNTALGATVDQLAAEITPEAAARDVLAWEENISFFGGTHAGEIAHLRNWLLSRAEWIDTQFVAPPTVTVTASNLIVDPQAGTRIAYTLDGSDPRARGGEIAANATVTASRVTLPLSANLHARSYREESKGVFPGSPWSSAATGSASTPLQPGSRLINLSSRAFVGSGENALIAGTVVADTAGKRMLARAVGPGLAAFGTAAPVPDPELRLYFGPTETNRNAGWSTGPDAARLPQLMRSVGAFALTEGSLDSALVADLRPGAYTIQAIAPGTAGIGLIELYELDANGRTANLSTRAAVGTDERVLIGGFVLQGTAHKRMLLRAVGPGLAQFGVSRVLPDPVLTLYSGATPIHTNDRWGAAESSAAITAAATQVQAFQLAQGSEDAALLVAVPPGAYTVEVRGKDAAEGVALLEMYEVP